MSSYFKVPRNFVTAPKKKGTELRLFRNRVIREVEEETEE